MKMLPLITMLALTGYVASPSAMAETIGWHPHLPLYLGRGVDINRQSLTKQSPVVLTGNPVGSNTGGASVDISYAQHSLDIAKSLNLNSSLSVKTLVFNGNVGFSLADNQTFSQNTVSFVYVSKRDFGTKFYAPVTFTPSFSNDVALLRTTLSGDALKKAITDTYGTHYVSGVQTMARVVVVYTFEYASQSVAQSSALSLAASYKSGVTKVNFNTTVQSQFNRTDTRVSMNYHFDTTDSLAPWPRATTGSITNYQQFLDFTAEIDAYAQNLSPTNAQTVGFVVDPIEQIPGYLSLVNLSATNLPSADYQRFMDAYGQLTRWDDLLSYWTLDPRRMSWLNTNGQQLVVNLRKDTTEFRRSLEDLAKRHFQDGEPLRVPDTVFNYFANFSRIPLPTINTLAYEPNFLQTGITYKIGYIMCGSEDLTRDRAFSSVTNIRDGVEQGFSLLDTMAEYTQRYGPLLNTGNAQERQRAAVINTVLWGTLLTLTNSQVLVYLVACPAGQEDRYSVALKDDAGNVIDVATYPSFSTSLSPQSFEASTSAALSFGTIGRDTVARHDVASVHEFAVTNNGPGAAHGITVNVPVPSGLRVLAVSGTQGSGVVTNGGVLYTVGPLASGNKARIQLKVVPTATGTVSTASLATTAIGEGLTNIGTNSTGTLAPITVQPPALTHTRGSNYVELKWHSDADLLGVDKSSGLRNPLWNSVTNTVTKNGAGRTLRLPFDSTATFYRLRSQ